MPRQREGQKYPMTRKPIRATPWVGAQRQEDWECTGVSVPKLVNSGFSERPEGLRRQFNSKGMCSEEQGSEFKTPVPT